jgi:type I restriction enzyme M protein
LGGLPHPVPKTEESIDFQKRKMISTIQERAELQNQIWKIANEVRGFFDGWNFKQYVLGTLFYRFISEHFAAYRRCRRVVVV